MSALLVSLRCPVCAQAMSGSGASRVYACSVCKTARFMERPEEVYPFRALAPKGGPGPLQWAPFWRVEGTADWRVENREKSRAYANAKPLKALYFAAFWTLRAGQHESLTQRYALWDEPFEEVENTDVDLLPGLLDPACLAEMARLTWLAYLDRIADVSDVTLTYRAARVAYVAVPFRGRPEGWEDCQIGLLYPESYFRSARL